MTGSAYKQASNKAAVFNVQDRRTDLMNVSLFITIINK